ncbi:protein cordon-bleu isoform X2 [Pyxicephalus adspersus]|uniref:protein cordon-bleu isoform X2 n=1 Tax=Pyxicephalus adspersus TaxID=30357 RepID=UPI003B5AF4A2
MSCSVFWQPVKDYVYSDSASSDLSRTKQHSRSLGDLMRQGKTRSLGVSLGTYIITSSKKIKARAPPPPQPTPKPYMEHTSSTDSDGIGNQSTEESKENLLHRKVDITVCLPDGQEKTLNVDGSKAVMDFLVDLCIQHHLNPAQHTLEARSGASQQPFLLRPNTLIGTLDLQTIFLKEKVTEAKVRKPAPKIPEKTVRLVVNYLGTQKAVVRVNPAVQLWDILPAVCEKCEFHHENVTLLRDAVSREELDMSQSLNDLGIKELYAWNIKQEKNGKFSSGSDTAEKEKKGILGFFRSHKKGNKVNETTVGRTGSDHFEEILQTASISGNRCEGFLTAPSSPSLNSRSLALGASLSLNNISGIGTRTEVKKRRAPPPPQPAPQGIAAVKTPEDKITEPVFATVQKELQKKKRRAPPPPTPQMPNEKNEDLDKRKSSTGNGRQVPQKPPRGTSRSPPHLVIPPPPPYPPPDNDIMDPSIYENGAAITGSTKPIPAKRGKTLKHSSSITSEEVLTTDDVGSVNSYTEDSGIVSSPSDSVSLDLQTDSCKKDENTNNATYKANSQPSRAESLNSDDSWSLNTSSRRVEDEVTLVRNGDEDIFITTQFQETLAELEEDSEDMSHGDHIESNHISARISPVGEESTQVQEYKESGAAVPVTIIDEIPEDTTYNLKYNINTTPPANDLNGIKKFSALTNATNIISNVESVARKTYVTHSSVQSPDSPVVKPSSGSFKQSTDISKQPTYERVYSLNTSDRPKNVIESPSSVSTMSTFPIRTEHESNPVKDKANLMPINSQKIGIKENQTPQNNTNKVAESTKPTLWRQQTYEPKVGMTTFTVVPAKPTVKKYDRSVSLSSSAIKIDDQGNLISPQSSFDKNDGSTNDTESTHGEKPLIARAMEFWRSSSMDAQAGESKEQLVKKIVPVKNTKPNEARENKTILSSSKGFTRQISVNNLNDKDNTLFQNKPVPTTAPQENVIIIENRFRKTDMPLIRPTLNNKQPRQVNETTQEIIYKGKLDQGLAISNKVHGSQQTTPVLSSATYKEKMIIIEKTNQEKTELPFLKPAKRTSSQYVASAIFKYTEPSNTKTPEASEVKRDPDPISRSSFFLASSINTNANVTLEEPKKIIFSNKQETYTELNANPGNRDNQLGNKVQSTNKSVNLWQTTSETKKDDLLTRTQKFNGPVNGNITVLEKLEKNTAVESSHIHPISNVPSNAFLKAVREKSMKIEQANALAPLKAVPAYVTIIRKEDENETDTIPSTVIDGPDITDSNPVFGPKAKFRPVVQKPVQKDTSLHSALMGAIQSGEGKEKLRKIQCSPTDGGEKKLCEPENERSALLSAIRAHNGISRLKKVSSAASDELLSIRKAENESPTTKTVSIPLSPAMPPPPPPPPTLGSAHKSPPIFANTSVDAREALMEAIRSGQGASKLKKVSTSVRTL